MAIHDAETLVTLDEIYLYSTRGEHGAAVWVSRKSDGQSGDGKFVLRTVDGRGSGRSTRRRSSSPHVKGLRESRQRKAQITDDVSVVEQWGAPCG